VKGRLPGIEADDDQFAVSPEQLVGHLDGKVPDARTTACRTTLAP